MLCMTSSPILPAQLISCLSKAPNVATCYTGRAGRFPDFIEQVTLNFEDMDAMYVVSWKERFPKLSHCMPVSIMKPGDEDDGDDEGEGESDSGQAVDPPPRPKATRRPPSLRARAVVMMMSSRGTDNSGGAVAQGTRHCECGTRQNKRTLLADGVEEGEGVGIFHTLGIFEFMRPALRSAAIQ